MGVVLWLVFLAIFVWLFARWTEGRLAQAIARSIWCVILLIIVVERTTAEFWGDLVKALPGLLLLLLIGWWLLRTVWASNVRLAEINARSRTLPPIHPVRRAVSLTLALVLSGVGLWYLQSAWNSPEAQRTFHDRYRRNHDGIHLGVGRTVRLTILNERAHRNTSAPLGAEAPK
jgi:hypothetical protein